MVAVLAWRPSGDSFSGVGLTNGGAGGDAGVGVAGCGDGVGVEVTGSRVGTGAGLASCGATVGLDDCGCGAGVGVAGCGGGVGVEVTGSRVGTGAGLGDCGATVGPASCGPPAVDFRESPLAAAWVSVGGVGGAAFGAVAAGCVAFGGSLATFFAGCSSVFPQ
jgi:hypothetical protein